jgi:hypothetical protein
VMEEAYREYKNLVDSKAWKPALHAPDVKIPPSGFGASLAAGCQPVGAGPLSAEAFALIQTLNRLVPHGGGSGPARAAPLCFMTLDYCLQSHSMTLALGASTLLYDSRLLYKIMLTGTYRTVS